MKSLKSKTAFWVLPLMLVTWAMVGLSSARANGEPCSKCGPSQSWIPVCSPGVDSISKTSVVLGIDFDLDGNVDQEITLGSRGLFIMERSDPGGTASMGTEILEMCYGDGEYQLIAGLGQGGIIEPSTGSIVEDTSNASIGHSAFTVYFELTTPSGILYNQDYFIIVDLITCVPPRACYQNYPSCLALYDNPEPGQGTHVANLITMKLCVNSSGIPSVSYWGLATLIILLLGSGWWVFRARSAG